MLVTIQKENKSKDRNNTFSLIIPTWNNLPYLTLCLESITKHSDFHHQIIVLINEGSDGTLEWVQSQESLDYVYSPENRGICFGLNSCRSLVNTDFIVYINDDMYLLPHWDLELHQQMQSIPHFNYILSSTMIEPYDTNNPCVIVKNYGDSLKTFEEKRLLSEFADLEKADWQGSTWPPLIMHRDLWDLVGGMSVEFSPGMYSDPDLSMKLWQAGIRHFKGVGRSRVYHFGSKSTARVKKNTGRTTFLLKWGISSGYFTKKILLRGTRFKQPLPEHRINGFTQIIHRIKRAFASF
ncbi:MAG: glycosyltransferase family 2 protein [Cocleimonas sp.]|nr:glycosyltransferase family 2 protein [Cocleimonas sp.]